MSAGRPRRDGLGRGGAFARGERPTVAGALAVVVLIVVGVLSVDLLGGSLPTPGLATSGGVAGDVPNRTPDPVKVFAPLVATRPQLRGTILFAKAGNLWSVSGTDVLTQLTTAGTDQSPIFSPDGRTIYFIRLKSARGDLPCAAVSASGCLGTDVHLALDYPVLMAMPAGGGAARELWSGLYSWGGGRYSYFSGLWQPAIRPDGLTFAVISDAPDPLANDYQVELLDARTGELTRPPLAADYGVGHNDPTWSPDGSTIAYSYNHRQGALGRPMIALYNVRTHTSAFLTGAGYAQPSYAPNGRYLVAVRTDAKGRDLVILDATSGAEILRLTDDGRSFAPAWSPAGNQIVFLRAHGLALDLWLATLSGTGPSYSVVRLEPLTSQSLLDGTSKPSWYIPPAELPIAGQPLASPAPTSGSGSILASPSPSGP